MNGNIFKHEFRMNLNSVVVWSIAVTALMFVYISMFSSFTKDAELLNEMMANFPEELLAAFGMTGIDLSTILGFFSIAFLLAQICLAIQASNYGFSMVSIEERELTADFLLAKPVGRTRILTSKFLAALSGLTITNIVVWISSFGFLQLFKGDRTYEGKPLLLLLLSIIVFQLFFLSVGLVISLMVKRVRSVTPYSMALAFGMYVLSVFGDMLGENILEKITPFQHFNAQYILQNAAYDFSLVIISVSVIVISLVGGYLLYNRRDIPSPV